MNTTELFLSALDESAENFHFQTFDDSEEKRKHLISSTYATLDRLKPRLAEYNDSGAGVFVCINELRDGHTRSNETVSRIRAVFVDLDGSPLQPVLEADLEPHMVVDSGGGDGHHHAYWLVDDLPVNEFPDIQRALAARFNADPKVCDPARVMRLPGFRNRKPGGDWVSVIGDALQIQPYSADKIRAFAGPPPARDRGIGSQSDVITAGSRNETLFRKACALRGAGHNLAEAGALIKAMNDAQCVPPLSAGELSTILKSAFKYQPNESKSRSFTYDDLGNARKLVAEYGEMIRYMPEPGKWMMMDPDSCLWQMVKDTQINYLAHHIADQLRADSQKLKAQAEKAPENEELGKLAKSSEKWADKSRSSPRLLAMPMQAACMPEVQIEPSAFDADPMALAVKNGVLDLRTQRLRDIQPGDYITKRCAVEYDPAATCPVWEQFVLGCCDGDLELAAYVQRAIGYSMTASTKEQVFFMILGPGGNGKSTFLESIRGVLGDYAQASTANVFQTRHPSAPSNDIARLVGSRFVTAPELSPTRRLDDSLLKQLVGGDKIMARLMYKEYFEFQCVSKIWISGNDRPDINDISDGIWRRLILIEFPRNMKQLAYVEHLPQKLKAERSGTLNWMIQGAKDWQERGLDEPSAVTMARKSYRSETDSIEDFKAHELEHSIGKRPRMRDVQSRYMAYCKEMGVTPKTQNQFRKAMRESYEVKNHAGYPVLCDVDFQKRY